MGSWLSSLRFSWSNNENGVFNKLKSDRYFNLRLAPTPEELCSDDETEYDSCDSDDDDDGDSDNDECLPLGQPLRSRPIGWAYDEPNSVLRNRRPYQHRPLA